MKKRRGILLIVTIILLCLDWAGNVLVAERARQHRGCGAAFHRYYSFGLDGNALYERSGDYWPAGVSMGVEGCKGERVEWLQTMGVDGPIPHTGESGLADLSGTQT